MGIIYSPSQVEAGNVPSPGDHARVGEYLLDRLIRPGDGAPILTALVYGSTALGTATTRSDLDLLIVHKDGAEERAFEHVQSAVIDAKLVAPVHVEAHFERVNPWEKEDNFTDPLYIRHLGDMSLRDEGKWLRGVPLDELFEVPVLTLDTLYGLANDFTRAKASKFSRVSNGSLDLPVLQRALEIPRAIQRKIRPYLDRAGVEDKNDRRFSGLLSYVNVLSVPSELRKTESELIELDTQYNAILQSTLDAGMSVAEYVLWLEENYRLAGKLAYIHSSMWNLAIRRVQDHVWNGN